MDKPNNSTNEIGWREPPPSYAVAVDGSQNEQSCPVPMSMPMPSTIGYSNPVAPQSLPYAMIIPTNQPVQPIPVYRVRTPQTSWQTCFVRLLVIIGCVPLCYCIYLLIIAMIS